MQEKKEISKATFGRLPLYLRFLQEEMDKGKSYISSSVIAHNISVSSVLVRKDLEVVSSTTGIPRRGFGVARLIADIEKFLGYDNRSDVVVVGAGGLGKAFLGYEGFKNNGLSIVAAFDVDERLIGSTVAGKPVYSMNDFEEFVSSRKIRIGIIAAPKNAAQEILDKWWRQGLKPCGILPLQRLLRPRAWFLKRKIWRRTLQFCREDCIGRKSKGKSELFTRWVKVKFFL